MFLIGNMPACCRSVKLEIILRGIASGIGRHQSWHFPKDMVLIRKMLNTGAYCQNAAKTDSEADL